ncbi:MAG: thioredoxin family protein [archaeon]
MKKIFCIIVLIFLFFVFFGCTQNNSSSNKFIELEGSLCKEENKPIVRMFSTTSCPHCQWVKPAFEEVVKKYVDENKIIAYHWEWGYDEKTGASTGDNTLTPPFEGIVPSSEEKVFLQFSPNGSVPLFVIGCRYYRIGNQFEKQNDLNAEKDEFQRIIEEILK